jgi:hypothetical protein
MLTTHELNGVRLFDDDNIQRAVDRATAALSGAPNGHFAAVAHADLNGVSISGLVKLGDAWSVAAACYKPWTGPLSAEAEVVWTPNW